MNINVGGGFRGNTSMATIEARKIRVEGPEGEFKINLLISGARGKWF